MMLQKVRLRVFRFRWESEAPAPGDRRGAAATVRRSKS